MLLEPGQTALVVEQAVQRVGLAEEPLGVDQRSAEQLDEAAGAQRAGEQVGTIDGAQQVDGLAELQPCFVESAGGVVHAAEQAVGVALGSDVAALRRRWPGRCRGRSRAASKSRRSSSAPARISCSCTRRSSCSAPVGSSSSARVAWRTATRRLPLSSARSAAAVSSCDRLVGDRARDTLRPGRAP